MIKRIKDLFAKHEQDLEELNAQRRKWLYASSIVLTGIVLLIFSWNWLDDLHSKSIWWIIISIILVISINWWYWTMRVVAKFLSQQKLSLTLIQELADDIKEIKNEVKHLKN